MRRTTKIVVGVVVLAAVAVPVAMHLHAKHERNRRIDINGNMKSIGLALIMYAGDEVEGAFFPDAAQEDLGDLHQQKYLVDGKVYCVPVNPAQASDYTYIGSGLKQTNRRPTTASLCGCCNDGKHENHPDKDWTNVLFIDGHVNGSKPEK